MGRINSPSSSRFSNDYVGDLPRHVVQRLLMTHGMGIGTRVLDVGCGSGEFTGYLNFLGIDAVGMDDSPETIRRARQVRPQLDFQYVRPSETLPWQPQSFDLAIVRWPHVYSGDLSLSLPLHVTANILSSVRPGGLLVLLDRVVSQPDVVESGHQLSCWVKHLSAFPGTCRVRCLDAESLSATVWNRLLHRHSPNRFQLTSLRTPAEPVPLKRWQQFALDAASCFPDGCCEYGRLSPSLLETRPGTKVA